MPPYKRAQVMAGCDWTSPFGSLQTGNGFSDGGFRRRMSYCCVPTGCNRYAEDPILESDPGDAVRMVCSNSSCPVSKWMHKDCHGTWEQKVAVFIRSSLDGNLQGCLTKEGCDLIFRACACICGTGFLRKNISQDQHTLFRMTNSTAASPAAAAAAAAYQKLLQAKGHHGFQPPQFQQLKKLEQSPVPCMKFVPAAPAVVNGVGYFVPVPIRIRSSSISSTCSSPSSSTATPPPMSPHRTHHVHQFPPTTASELTSRSTNTNSLSGNSYGNIFRHRSDLSAFRILPKTVQNPIHIKVEDDGPHGNDQIRSFLMKNLSRNQVQNMLCVVCNSSLPIFDEFPLIDGTFFLSPYRYNSSSVRVTFERRLLYLNAVCLCCMEGKRSTLTCRGCNSPWDGSSLIIGTMYSYDVFAAMGYCCKSRLSCRSCHNPIADGPPKFFSDYSRLARCPHCQVEDYHYSKNIDETFVYKQLL